jgi:glycine hydroxymethyltransferase
MHTIAAKAVCFKEALRPQFTDYNRQIVKNCRLLAQILMDGGLRLVSGGTDNHLLLIDLSDKGMTGLEAEKALGCAGITVNKNTIPRETRSPFVTSGLRIGTPTVTSRRMKEPEMRFIGAKILQVLSDIRDEPGIARVRDEVASMATRFPIYPE